MTASINTNKTEVNKVEKGAQICSTSNDSTKYSVKCMNRQTFSLMKLHSCNHVHFSIGFQDFMLEARQSELKKEVQQGKDNTKFLKRLKYLCPLQNKIPRELAKHKNRKAEDTEK